MKKFKIKNQLGLWTMILIIKWSVSLFFYYNIESYKLFQGSDIISFLGSLTISLIFGITFYFTLVWILVLLTPSRVRRDIIFKEGFVVVPNVNAYPLLKFWRRVYHFHLDENLKCAIEKNAKRANIKLDVLYIKDGENSAELYHTMFSEGDIYSLKEEIEKLIVK